MTTLTILNNFLSPKDTEYVVRQFTEAHENFRHTPFIASFALGTGFTYAGWQVRFYLTEDLDIAWSRMR